MRFGFRVHPYSSFSSLAQIDEFVSRGEELGLDYVCLPEHVLFPVAHERTMGQPWWDPLIMGTHLADRTERLGIYFCVLVAPLHNPVRLAKQIASLDAIAGGRVVVGLAPGWMPEEIEWLGGPVRERGADTEECIAVLRSLWADGPSAGTYRGITFGDASCYPKPPRLERTPIYVGGTVGHSARRAARLGDGWIPSMSTQADFESAVARLRSELTAAGRDPAKFRIAKYLPLYELSPEVQEHTEETGARVEPALHGDIGAAREYVSWSRNLGVTELTALLPPDIKDMMPALESWAGLAASYR